VTVTISPYSDAVLLLADRIKARDQWLIVAPPANLGRIAHRIAQRCTHWTAHLDNGTGHVLTIDRAPGVISTAETIAPVAAVFTIPKTGVSGGVIAKIVGQPVARDGSQDIVLLHLDGQPMSWPTLLVDAFDEIDPVAASTIRANQVDVP
jgi:hypothetical protein